MATIKEVAELAGVTPTTVSNVLRERGRVGEATRERVLKAVAAKGYRPNLNARALVERRAPTLALMVGCITNPFYPEFTLQANNAARRHGRFLLVCNTDYEPDGGTSFLADVAGSLSDGILVANNGELRIEELKVIQASGTPVVISVWEHPDVYPGIPCVVFDSPKAGFVAAEHLIDLGHRRIGALVASKKNGIHGGRYQGFREALRARKVKHVLADAHFGKDSYQGGYDAAIELLTRRPDLTALFVSNDLPALGALNAAASLGLNVPEDLSIVGITDIELASQSRPALTTVAIPTAEMAEQSIELLIKLASNAHDVPHMVRTAEPVLIQRASTTYVKQGTNT
ncbi:LacI family DNA-binding transcriptional regulator [Burkholderia gladioli pv. gladioli]|nr:LacI family DNA-binding transcriptional regulator [Burkholderia gladioli]AJW98009.1 periplasmic binding s and sugar binding domain of LacI family protein [Burkholderia gladioli]ASD79952.1 LacI family transcriptional regulator [Burkholderia gladioli pv. gladioli]AWY56889.1 LacI family transcriptional regulator [Burkholderia gladioli pv. gladioli]MDJ1164203.1 LacI family DNA-binding transcriptional regulator [Burkholderia gladioli pv. gladioli]PEH40214.1 LacI family transcriptional regulator 